MVLGIAAVVGWGTPSTRCLVRSARPRLSSFGVAGFTQPAFPDEILPKWRSIDVGPQTDIALRRRFRALTAATGGRNGTQRVERSRHVIVNATAVVRRKYEAAVLKVKSLLWLRCAAQSQSFTSVRQTIALVATGACHEQCRRVRFSEPEKSCRDWLGKERLLSCLQKRGVSGDGKTPPSLSLSRECNIHPKLKHLRNEESKVLQC